ncbi:MAG: macro domain-containing protein [Trueperaceae bacterium]|nr:macro domain-containing protein [Trueperaceae bacterium]
MTLPTPRIDLRPERGALPAGGGTVRALVDLAVDFPPSEREREPLSLALVIDRSGSMSGAPLEHAKQAAVAAVTALRDGDRVAVVAYDQRVDLVVPSTAVGEDRGPIARAIAGVRAGNTTALHAGWVEGCTQVLTAPVASGLGRVVLLSDGLANVGVTDPAAIADDVARVTADGVTTSTIGLGRQFDEGLMRHLADAGGGSFTFVESPEQLEGLFETELAGLSALRGRRVTLELRGRGVRFVAALGGARLAGDGPAGTTLELPDLVAGLPREFLVTLEVEPDAQLDGLRLAWHDTFTRAPEALDADLDVPTLPDADVRRRPMVEAVASAERQARSAEGIHRIEALTRDGRLPEAEAALEALSTEAASWPADEARAAQLADIAHMLEAVRLRDDGLAKKRAFRAVYERERGVRGGALHAMAAMERDWTDAYKARTAASTAAERHFTLLRPDGSEARVEIVVGDLTTQRVDAIVNPSNRGLFGTAGVDGAVHRRGGPELTAACREIGGIKHGQAVVTPGFRLPAGRVIHTTTHPWKGGQFDELATLAAAYAASFEIARRLRLRTLALPAIGTGAYGYPADVATEVAVNVTLRALLQPGELSLVRFVLFEPRMAELYRRVCAQAVPQAAPPRAGAAS